MDYGESEKLRTGSLFKTGAIVSVVQSVLFFVIALSALALGIDRFISDGFENLYAVNPPMFIVLCGAFVLIAVLGLAITPAEKKLIECQDDGPASWGSSLANFGHMGTIAFFSWWILFVTLNPGVSAERAAVSALMPIRWGVMFELFFVGAWVWIIAYVLFRRHMLSRAFRIVSVCKAVSFWFAFAAFIANSKVLLLVGVGLVAAVFGPLWHLWIAIIFRRNYGKVRRS